MTEFKHGYVVGTNDALTAVNEQLARSEALGENTRALETLKKDLQRNIDQL